MTARLFKIGERFTWTISDLEPPMGIKSSECEVVRLVNGEVEFVDIATGVIQTEAHIVMVDALYRGEIAFHKADGTPILNSADSPYLDLDDVPKPLLAIAKRRERLIKPLLDLMPSDRSDAIKVIVEEEKAKNAKSEKKGSMLRAGSPSTLRRWIKAYEDSERDIRALIPKTRDRGGEGESRLTPEIDGLIDATIQQYILNSNGQKQEQYPIRYLERMLALDVERINKTRSPQEKLPPPSYATIWRRIKKVDLYDRMVALHGRRIADREFRQYEKMVEPMLPLERVEIDHTILDVIVVDPINRKMIGRPNLTIAIDCATRAIHGFYLSFDSLSYKSRLLPTQLYPLFTGLFETVIYLEGQMSIWRGKPPEKRLFAVRGISQIDDPETRFWATATAMQGVLDWPNGFNCFLDSLQESTYKKRGRGVVVKGFHPLYQKFINNEWNATKMQFVQSAFDDYLIQNHVHGDSITRMKRYKQNPSFKERVNLARGQRPLALGWF